MRLRFGRQNINNIHTFKKNSPPAGRKILCDPVLPFNCTPSLYQDIIGDGVPSALQFKVAGSCLGTVVSIGCSLIRGAWNPKRTE